MRISLIVAFALGIAVAIVSFRIDGWWLDSSAGVLHMVLSLLAVGLIVALWQQRAPWAGGLASTAGAVAGTTGVLFRMGPGTLWPIALVVAACVSAAAVLTGVSLALAAGRLRR
jgi:hypothetical protein